MAAQPKLPCRFFLQNSCTRGETCQYSHDRGPPSAGSRRPTTVTPSTGPWISATVPPSTRSWRPTTVPVSTESGRSAAPALSFRANAPGVDVSTVQPRTYGQQPSPPTVVQDGGGGLFLPCKFFQKGFCSRGISCKFAHVLAGNSQLSERLPIGHGVPAKETTTTANEVSLRPILLDAHKRTSV